MIATSSSLNTVRLTFLKMNLVPYANPRFSQANSPRSCCGGIASITAFDVTRRVPHLASGTV